MEAGKTHKRRAQPGHLDGFASALLEIAGVPTAPPPPVFDPPTWASVCRVDPEVQHRCGSCVLCEYERELDRFAALAPYKAAPPVERELSEPVFGSLSGALLALAEWRAHGRHGASQMGPLLDRLRMGQTGGGGKPGGAGSRLLDRAEDVAHVDRALRQAYARQANPAHLPPELAELLLLVRTPGVLGGEMPSYVAIAKRLLEADYVATPRELKRTVRHGRRAVTVELAARGLIRQPNPTAGLAEAIWVREQELEGARGAA